MKNTTIANATTDLQNMTRQELITYAGEHNIAVNKKMPRNLLLSKIKEALQPEDSKPEDSKPEDSKPATKSGKRAEAKARREAEAAAKRQKKEEEKKEQDRVRTELRAKVEKELADKGCTFKVWDKIPNLTCAYWNGKPLLEIRWGRKTYTLNTKQFLADAAGIPYILYNNYGCAATTKAPSYSDTTYLDAVLYLI